MTFLLGCVGTAHAQSEFSAGLSGAEEVPPVATSAFGSATFDVNFSENTLGVNFHLSATNLKQAFMAHVTARPRCQWSNSDVAGGTPRGPGQCGVQI